MCNLFNLSGTYEAERVNKRRSRRISTGSGENYERWRARLFATRIPACWGDTDKRPVVFDTAKWYNIIVALST